DACRTDASPSSAFGSALSLGWRLARLLLRALGLAGAARAAFVSAVGGARIFRLHVGAGRLAASRVDVARGIAVVAGARLRFVFAVHVGLLALERCGSL